MRIRWAAALLVLALMGAAFATACGGGKSDEEKAAQAVLTELAKVETPSDEDKTPEKKETPSAKKTPTEAAEEETPSGDAGDLPKALEVISKLESFKMTASGQGTSGDTDFKFDMEMIKAGDDRKVTFTSDEDGTKEETGFVLIGDRFWELSAGAYEEVPGGGALASSLLDAFSPVLFFGLAAGVDTSGFKSSSDTVNGISATHYSSKTSGGAGLELLGQLFGEDAATGEGTIDELKIDVWVAKDGGYPVKSSISATGKDADGKDAEFTLEAEMTDINDDSLKVEPPQ